MSVNALNASMSGLKANQLRQNVTANNVANVNTEGFRPATVQTSDVAEINGAGQGTQASATYAPPRMPPAEPVASAQMAAPAANSPAPQSNVDMITESTNRMNAQSAYNANVPAARAADQMSQTLMDLRG